MKPPSPGRSVPRMSDIAERAGVSRMAASAVLMGTGQGRIRVSEATAKRIRDIASEMGYQPNLAARQLAGGRSGVIAIVAHDWKNFLAQRVLVWLHEAAEQQGFRVLATRLTQGLPTLEQITRELQAGWFDGLVYLAHENQDQWTDVAALLQQFSPVVTAVGELHIPNAASVISDVATGATQTIEHLATRGYRRPIVVAEQITTIDMQQRLESYQRSGQQQGLRFDASSVLVETQGWQIGDPAFHERFNQLARLILHERQADCVICDTDFTAAGLIAACRRLEVSVPDELAIVGWGDLQFAGVFDPPLTTVSHRLEPLMDAVIQQLTSPHEVTHDVQRIPTELIVRASA